MPSFFSDNTVTCIVPGVISANIWVEDASTMIASSCQITPNPRISDIVKQGQAISTMLYLKFSHRDHEHNKMSALYLYILEWFVKQQ